MEQIIKTGLAELGLLDKVPPEAPAQLVREFRELGTWVYQVD